MDKFRIRDLGKWGLALACLVVPIGCENKGIDRSIKASRSMVVVDAEIRTLSTDIDDTAKALDLMLNSSEGDMKRSFEKFKAKVDVLDRQGERVIQREEEMALLSKNYFSEWEIQGSQYTNSLIKQLSEERRLTLAGVFNRFTLANSGLKRSYLFYIASLREIVLYLSTDLTPKGVKAIKSIGDKTIENLIVLRAALEPVIQAINEINSELYSGPTKIN